LNRERILHLQLFENVLEVSYEFVAARPTLQRIFLKARDLWNETHRFPILLVSLICNLTHKLSTAKTSIRRRTFHTDLNVNRMLTIYVLDKHAHTIPVTSIFFAESSHTNAQLLESLIW
jgi:hypothetical protein